MKTKHITIKTLVFFLVALTAWSSLPVQAENKSQDEDRMQWWREARFGLFIHWGLYSITAGVLQGEDIDGISSCLLFTSKKPLEVYTPLVDQFNPVKFDPKYWVSLAKEAGMKYIVLVTKHHDGFCLFDSKYTDYDVMSSPFKRDILTELAEATRKEGLRLGWYYSIIDWHHPDYLPRRTGDTRSTQGASFERYLDFMSKQLDEIFTNYGPIDIAWFDGEWESTWNRELGWKFYNGMREKYPKIIINNRIGGGRAGMAGMDKDEGYAGDFGTPERTIPPTGLGDVAWESCMTMNETWGYKKKDHDWKSATVLTQMLIDCACKGGNFLLNIGPKADGTIPQPSIDRLKAIGRWMKINSESIYGTQASPFEKQLAWGRCSRRSLEGGTTRLYLHIFDWPKDGQLTVPGLQNKPIRAYLLAKPDRALVARKDKQNVVIALPAKATDPVASVLVLDIAGKPNIKR